MDWDSVRGKSIRNWRERRLRKWEIKVVGILKEWAEGTKWERRNGIVAGINEIWNNS